MKRQLHGGCSSASPIVKMFRVVAGPVAITRPAMAIAKQAPLVRAVNSRCSIFRIVRQAPATGLPARRWMKISDGREFSVAASLVESFRHHLRKQTPARLR